MSAKSISTYSSPANRQKTIVIQSMATAPTLSTPQDESVFYAKVAVSKPRRRSNIAQYYSLDELADAVKKYKRITLQFPDELVGDSAAVAYELQSRLDKARALLEKEDPEAGNGQTALQNENDKTAETKETSECRGDVDPAAKTPKQQCSSSPCSTGNNSCACSASCSSSCSNSDAKTSSQVWILADTSYSPCCVDEVAAQHVLADVVVHFGDACLNPVASLAAVYVFGRPHIDLDLLVTRLREKYTPDSQLVLMADTPHTPLLHELQALVPELNTTVADIYIQDKLSVVGYKPRVVQEDDLRTLNRVFPGISDEAELQNYDLFHISEPKAPRMLQLTTKFQSVTTVDAETGDFSLNPAPALARRYRYMHMARSAATVGLLVNTLSLAHTRTLMNSLARQLREAGKKHYLFVVGKPNVAKLANFDAVDMWCVLGCDHQGIILDETREYFKPIVTPYELVLALSDEFTWTGQWVTDFQQVLTLLKDENEDNNQEGNSNNNMNDESDGDDEPEFDSVTGRYVSARPLRRLRHLQIEQEAEEAPDSNTAQQNGSSESGASNGKNPSNQLVKKLSSVVAVRGTYSTSAAHLQTREWTGLGSDWTQDEDDEGAEVEEGRSGIARGYDFDRENRH